MKNLKNYIVESTIINEFLGFGGSKQIDFAKQLCSGIVGVSYVFRALVKKLVPSYDGTTLLRAAFVKGDKIVFCTNKTSQSDYDLSDSQNIRILILDGNNKQYSIRFDGVEDDNEKLGKNEQHQTLVYAINGCTKDDGAFTQLFEELYKYGKENEITKKVDTIQNQYQQLLDALKKKQEGLLDFGTENGAPNTKYIDKIVQKLMKA